MPRESGALFGVLDQFLKTRFQASCLVSMNQPAGASTVQPFCCHAIDLFSFFKVSSCYSFADLANVGSHVRSNRTVPGSMCLVLL